MMKSASAALAASARVLDRELRNPSPNPLLPRPVPQSVVRAWRAYRRRLREVLATRRGNLGTRATARGLVAAFKRVENAVGEDRRLRAALRFHGALLKMAPEVEPPSERRRP